MVIVNSSGLTRRIIESQGGTVGVHSTFGRGSVFHAVLPLAVPQSDTSKGRLQ